MSTAAFVHLRVYSAYSLLEGALPIAQLARLAVDHQMPALALTDRNNLFGALEFSSQLSKVGVQPIVGCSIGLRTETDPESRSATSLASHLDHIVLLAKNQEGYANLMRLSSRAYLDKQDGASVCIDWAMLRDNHSGLILLSGGAHGPIAQTLIHSGATAAERQLDQWAQLFDDRLYIELQRHGQNEERDTEAGLVALAYRKGIPLIATNACYFESPGHFEAHDALLAVAEGKFVADTDRRRMTDAHYFKSSAEMQELFADLPEAIEMSIEVARRCSYWPKQRSPLLPHYQGADEPDQRGHQDEDSALRKLATDGLTQRLSQHSLAPGITRQAYAQRLDFELSVIMKMAYAGYFLIVADFIRWAKAQAIPVGPGRGSGAGSLVAWALNITDLDPMRFALLFERFLNPERVSMPDFDIDFCQERRDEVIAYVQDKYGRDRVAQIITFGSLQARAVLRDVGRVLQMSYGEVDRLAKLVPVNPASPVSLAQAIASEPRLQEAEKSDATVAQLLRIALKLEGLYRHASTHAAGLVIGDRPLIELVPLYRDPRALMPVTQFNMKWVEQAGLVKFDFLGLKTLTILQKTVELLAEHNIDLALDALPLDDSATYKMLANGHTNGVFQLESAGMRDALARMVPDRFEDIIALVALYRPGPMDNIPTYCARKQGKEQPDYLHPLLEQVLSETYGVIVYQEQVMQIAQILAGYSLGEADLLRRAMGKKIKSEMANQRARFLDGAQKNGIAGADAEQIFDLVAKFADYGFNKSHAAGYALLAYQTAYLKCHYPVEFIAASMSLDSANTDRLNDFCAEAKRIGITILPPCVNRSVDGFSPEKGAIRYGLGAVKMVGHQAAQNLIDERRRGGAFRHIGDFAQRIDPSMLNRRAMEQLAAAGAFDALGERREQVIQGADFILATAQRLLRERSLGQGDMFTDMTANTPENIQLPPAEAMGPMDRLTREHEALGLYLSGHPLDHYRSMLHDENVLSFTEYMNQLQQGRGPSCRLAGTILYRKERRNRNSGGRYAFVGLSDTSSQYEVMLFDDQLRQWRDDVEPGKSVVMLVEADQRGDGDTRLRVQRLESLEGLAARLSGGLRVTVTADIEPEKLKAVLSPGAGRVHLVVHTVDQLEVEVILAGRYLVTPRIASNICKLTGVQAVDTF